MGDLKSLVFDHLDEASPYIGLLGIIAPHTFTLFKLIRNSMGEKADKRKKRFEKESVWKWIITASPAIIASSLIVCYNSSSVLAKHLPSAPTFDEYVSKHLPLLNFGHMIVEKNLKLAGCVADVIATVLFFWTYKSLESQWSPFIHLKKKDHKLITSGPYAFVRHPLYLAYILQILSSTIITERWLLVPLAVLSTLSFLIRIPREEEMMTENFGQTYLEYSNQTCSLIWPFY